MLASCPAIWRVRHWPRLPLGDPGPRFTSDSTQHPWGQCSPDPHLCPHCPLVLRPWNFSLAGLFPSHSPSSAGSQLVGRQPAPCHPLWLKSLLAASLAGLLCTPPPHAPRALSLCSHRWRPDLRPCGWGPGGGPARPASQAQLETETKADFRRGGTPPKSCMPCPRFSWKPPPAGQTNIFSKALKPVTHSKERPLLALGPPAQPFPHPRGLNCSERGGARPARPAEMAGARELGGRPAGKRPSAGSQAHPSLPTGSCSTPRTLA